jgi:hypothetical protein
MAILLANVTPELGEQCLNQDMCGEIQRDFFLAEVVKILVPQKILEQFFAALGP